MNYRVECSLQMIECLKQMDSHSASIVLQWVQKYLDGCDAPWVRGRWLPGGSGDRWKYGIGCYTVLAEVRKEQGCIILHWVGANALDVRR